MYPVALTGGIGSGKTTIAHLFKTLYQIDIICADQIAKDVISLPQIISAITYKFGKNVIKVDGLINRTKLRELISQDHMSRLWLNDLMHPIIRQNIETQLANSSSVYTIIDIPLLSKETLRNYPYLKKVISVCASIETKVARIVKRDNQTQAQALLMIQSQISDDERSEFSDFIIYNDTDMGSLIPKVKQIDQQIRAYIHP